MAQALLPGEEVGNQGETLCRGCLAGGTAVEPCSNGKIDQDSPLSNRTICYFDKTSLRSKNGGVRAVRCMLDRKTMAPLRPRARGEGSLFSLHPG
jgi:hypothetical protein